jgi:hypothetical protein
MNEEFAIEPTAFRSFDDVRYVLGKFGFHEGRFISALPSKWVKEVFAQIEKLPDGPAKSKAKAIIIKTKDNGGIVSCGVDFDPTKSWLINATTCGKKFEGILVSSDAISDTQRAGCKSIDVIDDSFFGSCRDVRLSATVEEFGRIATRLLNFSHEVFLVDPYFNFSKDSNRDVLKEFVRIGAKGKCEKFVIYTDAKVNKPDGVEKLLRKHFQGCGASIRVFHVNQGGAELKFHPRYLLSKSGGIRFDNGFNSANEQRDVVAIDIDRHKNLCDLYLDGKHGFQIEAEHFFQG